MAWSRVIVDDRRSAHRTLARWLPRQWDALLFALITLELAVVWVIPWFPTQDGPSHVESASIVLRLLAGNSPVLHQWYELAPLVTPNWLGHAALAGLLTWLPPLVAEKVLVSGYIVLLPLAFRYAIVAIGPANAYLSILIVPFTQSFALYMGFYSFCYGCGVMAFVLGFWYKHRESRSIRHVVILAGLSCWLVLCHILTFLLVLASVSLWIAWCVIERLGTGAAQSEGPSGISALAAWRRHVPMAMALLPAVFVTAAVVLSLSTTGDLLFRLRRLLGLHSLASFTTLEFVPSVALALLFFSLFSYHAIGATRVRRIRPHDGALLVACLFAVLYVFAPKHTLGGGFIAERLLPLPYMVLPLWFAGAATPRWLRAFAASFAAGITVVIVVLHTWSALRIQPYFREYMSVSPLIQASSTMLPLSFSPHGLDPQHRELSRYVEVFLHAEGYIAAEKGLVNLNNYEAATRHFPTRYRGRNPQDYAGWIEDRQGEEAPEVRLDSLRAIAPTCVRYVVLWGKPASVLARQSYESVLDQLRGAYRLVFTSRPTGSLQLFENDACILE